ncbi:pyridoxal phosphate-dependent aminotransferase [Fusibacter paucivorans]|uniref:cysteine-S-conjugate beta-lyase n=1 Tax=Fusibacter paucivorans TaxID=76009 RepID=A0ABS5PLS6_9FIRM|nr:MalY/PatB family protein [Fusibacter paucivorans]MBS7525306.1 pyridoxal phosphate-dependent aminotransferase [Fusibacter paucivorans]
MSYNFNQVNNRRNTNSLKWDVAENELPLWVADMDFQTAPCIVEALEKRVKTGIFGYTIVPDAWYHAIQKWWQRRYQYEIDESWLIFSTGVVPAISTAVKRLTNVGDNVVLQTPVYNIFFNSVVNHGRHVLENKLQYEDGNYTIDFKDLEAKLAHPQTTMMILCNPHNPIGKLWDRETLSHIGELCDRYHVTVIADEIHCDLTKPGKKYTPFAAVSEQCAMVSVSCYSATKAFSIPGLQSAIISIPNEALRAKMSRGLNSDEVAEPNAFAAEAVIAAFNEGEAWLEALNAYIEANKNTVRVFLEKELPAIKMVDSEATYLLWLDMCAVDPNATEIYHFLRARVGLYLSDGSQFGGNGSQFLRMNIACPEETLIEALKRLKTGIDAYQQKDVH